MTLAFILRHWQGLAGLAVASILAALLILRTEERNQAREALTRERLERSLFAAQVTARAEAIARQFQENARRVETAQAQITQEVSSDYQSRIHKLGRRVAALRLRSQSAKPDPGTPGEYAVSGVPDPAGQPDGAAGDHGLSSEERIAATEQAIRLDELQRWIQRQSTASDLPRKGRSR